MNIPDQNLDEVVLIIVKVLVVMETDGYEEYYVFL